MRKIWLVFALMCMPMLVHAAVCPAGQYLVNGECLECPAFAYCPGDDTAKPCVDLWAAAGKPIPQAYVDSGGTNDASVLTATDGYAKVLDATTPDGCWCGFYEKVPKALREESVHASPRIWFGQCATGPVEYIGVKQANCDVGYYGRIRDEEKRFDLYKECAPCDNAPKPNSTYTGYGAPDDIGNIDPKKATCPWTCNDGYFLEFTENTDGTIEPNEENSVCRKLCSAGFRTLNIKTADKHITVRLYDEKKTSPSLHIGRSADNVCHADLLPDDPDNPQTGTLKIAYNGTVYYASSPLRTMDCSDANYYLTDGGSCSACGGSHYCPAGSNERISCATTFVDQTAQGIPLPVIYSRDGNVSGSTPESCQCRWNNLSDEYRANYFVINPCYQGMMNQNTYLYYDWCRVGCYATRPRGTGYYYRDCAPCYNGPANSHYTSYSTPSIKQAVESNCPWECNDGYVRNGDTCVQI